MSSNVIFFHVECHNLIICIICKGMYIVINFFYKYLLKSLVLLEVHIFGHFILLVQCFIG